MLCDFFWFGELRNKIWGHVREMVQLEQVRIFFLIQIAYSFPAYSIEIMTRFHIILLCIVYRISFTKSISRIDGQALVKGADFVPQRFGN